jgi:creatine kinase
VLDELRPNPTFFVQSVNEIKADLGLAASSARAVDPVGNFPLITDKHRSLTCKALKNDPSLYAKYANVKTPMGFTFDQAIQAGLDAPHLGVGIAAGEAAAYESYKDIMDIVIEGWHGYKPTDSHK